MADPQEQQEELPLGVSDADLFKSAREPEKAPDPEPSPDPVDQGAAPPPSPAADQVSSAVGGGAEAPKGADEAVPSWRLREEAEARRSAEERARKAQADLETLVQAIQAETAKEQRGQEPAPDFYQDPKKSVEAIVMEAIQPLAEHARASQMALNRLIASTQHTESALKEAEEAFLEGFNKRTLDVMEYEAVVQAPNRYDAVVKWHKRHKTLAAVGDDPTTYFDRQLEAKLADPAFQAGLLEKLRGAATKSGSSVVNLPPSLSRSTSAARASGEDLGDMSDASLFRFARDK